MHRLMMTSEAYQMSSQHQDAGDTEKDPDNQYLWRFRIQRLDAEIVRDAMMAASGALDLTIGGPAVFSKFRFGRNPPVDVRRHLEEGRRWTARLATQRLRVPQTRSPVPDVRGFRSARSEYKLRETKCLYCSDAGFDAAEREFVPRQSQALLRTG